MHVYLLAVFHIIIKMYVLGKTGINSKMLAVFLRNLLLKLYLLSHARYNLILWSIQYIYNILV